MEKENEKKGLFSRLAGGNKAQKSPCCCNVELEEIPEENANKQEDQKPASKKGGCCCG